MDWSVRVGAHLLWRWAPTLTGSIPASALTNKVAHFYSPWKCGKENVAFLMNSSLPLPGVSAGSDAEGEISHVTLVGPATTTPTRHGDGYRHVPTEGGSAVSQAAAE